MNQISQQPNLAGDAFSPSASRIAVISSCWHREIVAGAVNAIRDELSRSFQGQEDPVHYEVPGAFEIPLHAARLARTGRYEGIIACALVVNGGIYRTSLWPPLSSTA